MTDGAAEHGAGVPENAAQQPKEFERKKRSTEPVLAPDKVRSPDAAKIRTAGDATVVVKQGENPHIYSSDLQKLDLPHNALGMEIVDWPAIRAAKHWESMSNLMIVRTSGEIPSIGDYVAVDQLPPEIQPSVTRLIEASDERANGLKVLDFPPDAWRVPTDDVNNVQVDIADEYVLIGVPGTRSFVAYLRTEGGVKLDPMNWKRVDTLTQSSTTLPISLQEAINNLQDPNITGTTHVSSGNVLTTEEGLYFHPPGMPSFGDNVRDIGNNVCEDRTSGTPNGAIFYASERGFEIKKFDPTWKPPVAQTLRVPSYSNITNLKVDPSGSFITFASDGRFIVLDKGELEAGNVVVLAEQQNIYRAGLDDQGKLRGIDTDGHLGVYDADFRAILEAIEERIRLKAVEDARKATRTEDEIAADELAEQRARYDAIWGATITEEKANINATTTLEDAAAEGARLRSFVNGLAVKTPGDQVDYLRKEFDAIVQTKIREIAVAEVGARMNDLNELVRQADPWDTDKFDQALIIISRLQNMRADDLIHNQTDKDALLDIESLYAGKTREFRDVQTATIQSTVQSAVRHVEGIIAKLATYDSVTQWTNEGSILRAINLEFTRIADRFRRPDGTIDSAIEYEFTEAISQIMAKIKKREEFLLEQEADKGATPEEKRDAKIKGVQDQIDMVLRYIQSRNQSTREAIDSIRDNNANYQALETRLDELMTSDPMAGRVLRRIWGTRYALYIADVERRATAGSVDEHGRQMIQFGETVLPVREKPRVKHKIPKEVKLKFVADAGKQPQYVNGQKVIDGEIYVELTFENGKDKTKTVTRRLYEGKKNEEDYQNGVVLMSETPIPGTKVTNVEFNAIQIAYQEWERAGKTHRGPGQDVRVERAGLLAQSRELSGQRPVKLTDGHIMTRSEARDLVQEYTDLRDAQDRGDKVNESRITDLAALFPDLPRKRLEQERITLRAAQDRGETVDVARLTELDTLLQTMEAVRNWTPLTDGDETFDWEEDYRKQLKKYGVFAGEKHLALFQRIREISRSPETEERSDLGFIPTWQDTWTRDEQTSGYLAQIAYQAEAQLARKQGVISLEGDAGTGKDVLLEMFACELKRPVFTFDASKWTRESDFTEQITMRGGDVLKIPTSFLRGLQTPGAIVYINEFNAMPEDVQIFLNRLFDAKRQLTLKTSAGEVIEVAKDVLLFSSMNPGYRGTYEPQEATRSRQSPIIVDYPYLTKHIDPNDEHSKLIFSSADALRIARETDSLVDETFDLNPDHNKFIKMWDKMVNKIDTGITDAEITDVQKYDIMTILALVQFTDKLRKAFKARLMNQMGGFKVQQPIGRELGKCAYDLSKVAPALKEAAASDLQAAAEKQARALLIANYLPKTFLHKVEERTRIETEINAMTVTMTPS